MIDHLTAEGGEGEGEGTHLVNQHICIHLYVMYTIQSYIDTYKYNILHHTIYDFLLPMLSAPLGTCTALHDPFLQFHTMLVFPAPINGTDAK